MQTNIGNTNITIKVKHTHVERVKRAIRKGERLILWHHITHFVPTNVHLERWKDGMDHSVLLNHKTDRRLPQEVSLTGNKFEFSIGGGDFAIEIDEAEVVAH